MAVLIVIIPVILAGISLIGWISYLLFCRYLVNTTKDPASLDHAAVAAQGFRKGTASALAEVLGRLLGRGG